jgi:hypothetical protein
MPERGPRSVLCVVLVRHRARVDAGRHQAGDVSHVHHHRRADALRDLGDARELDHARVRTRADDDHLWLVLVGQSRQLVVIDAFVVLADPVRHDREQLAGEVQRMSVSEMTAVGEVHPEHGVSRLEEREVHAHVRLRPGVRLHVDVLRPEQCLAALHGQRFDDVHELAAAVVAAAGVALGVLVGQHGPRGLEDRAADEVFRGNQLQARLLAFDFLTDGVGDLGICSGKGVEHRWCSHLTKVGTRYGTCVTLGR